ncbi:leucine-rich repeat-containing protein 14-like [Centruroides vittatus]|uniref:leucine-rich repeat-containing protein 14-like n=1 Tax=Centruroides vittatus TaxID=120091 RepID=UPI00350EDD6C
MSLLNSSHIHSWNQVLQEVDYKLLNVDCHSSFLSLFECCCDAAVSDGQFFKKMFPYIPISFYPALMKSALKNGNLPSIHILLNVWSDPIFCLSSLVKPVYPHIRGIYDETNHLYLQQQQMYTSALINSFMNYLSNYSKLSKSKLRILDLQGFPIGDDKIYYIIKVILLSCGIREEKINFFMGKENLLHYGESRNYYYQNDCPFNVRCKTILDFNSILDNQPKIPSFPYKIKIDGIISKTSELVLYMLQSTEVRASPLKLEFCKVGLSGLFIDSLQSLLNSLQTYILKGLSLSYGSLTNEGIKMVSHNLVLFFNLTSLDLSYNSINLSSSSNMQWLLRDTFKSFQYLERLNLSNNRLTGYLKTILFHIGDSRVKETDFVVIHNDEENKHSKRHRCYSQGLHYLNVSGCRLNREDIEYLAESHHISTLKELDISDNNFNHSIKSIEKLLKALKNTIYILEMEGCRFSSEQLLGLTKILSTFSNLSYLNYARQKLIACREINEQLNYLQLIESLKVIRLSYPTIDEEPQENEATEIRKTFCNKKIIWV